MSILNVLKSYWQGNTALNSALPISSVFLGLVPPSVGNSYPYGVITEISRLPLYVTSQSHIEEFHWQIALYNTDFEALTTLADTIDAQLNLIALSVPTLNNMRSNRLESVEVINQQYTYQVVLEYVWMYNSSNT